MDFIAQSYNYNALLHVVVLEKNFVFSGETVGFMGAKYPCTFAFTSAPTQEMAACMFESKVI